jgi:competence protein ComFC
MRFLENAFRAVLDFLFPKSKRIVELEQLQPSELLRFLPPADPIANENVVALWSYEHSLVRELVWELKYRGNRVVAKKLGTILYDVIKSELVDRALFEKFESTPLLIPVPVSDKRRFERGWNQAELLCESIKECDKERNLKYLPRQLVKRVHTERQTMTSSKAERQRNIKNTMRVLHPDAVKRRCVVLVDDVTTTGSTFVEAKRALRAAGAKKVICVAIAH